MIKQFMVLLAIVVAVPVAHADLGLPRPSEQFNYQWNPGPGADPLPAFSDNPELADNAAELGFWQIGSRGSEQAITNGWWSLEFEDGVGYAKQLAPAGEKGRIEFRSEDETDAITFEWQARVNDQGDKSHYSYVWETINKGYDYGGMRLWANGRPRVGEHFYIDNEEIHVVARDFEDVGVELSENINAEEMPIGWHTFRLLFYPNDGGQVNEDGTPQDRHIELYLAGPDGWTGTPEPIYAGLRATTGAMDDPTGFSIKHSRQGPTNVDLAFFRMDTTGAFPPIPEPATASIVLVGVCLIAARRRHG